MLKKLSGHQKRQLALKLLGRVHCGLIAGIVFGTLFDFLHSFELTASTAYTAFFRGMLFAVPAALSSYAVRRFRTLWQYIPMSLLLCGLGWLLLGHIGGAVLTALLCILRARARMQEEDEGPVRSLFDYPTLPVLGLFVVCFLISASVGLPALQKLSVGSGVLYLLTCLLYKGIARVDDYLTLNQDMHNLPARRIQRIAGTAVAAGVLLSAILLLPPALTADGQVRIELPSNNSQGAPREFQSDPSPADTIDGDQAEFLATLAEQPAWRIPPVVTYILTAGIGILLLLGLLVMLRQLFKDFHHSYTDSRDLVQFIVKQESDLVTSNYTQQKRPRLWDRSPNAIIRRRYRKTVLRSAKDVPQSWMTPEELEEWAGVENAALHNLYEKARYSSKGCTNEEARQIR